MNADAKSRTRMACQLSTREGDHNLRQKRESRPLPPHYDFDD